MFLTVNNENIVFSMIDHGYGIPPEKQEKLFTKFYRVYNPNTTKEVGTGLGLAYVKEIATYHNGSITLESDPAIGCKFTITIPAGISEPTIENSTGGSSEGVQIFKVHGVLHIVPCRDFSFAKI
jgi:signal transduction histidine kinase